MKQSVSRMQSWCSTVKRPLEDHNTKSERTGETGNISGINTRCSKATAETTKAGVPTKVALSLATTDYVICYTFQLN